jgi:hypothetical protein
MASGICSLKLVAEQPTSFEIFKPGYSLEQLSIRMYFSHDTAHKDGVLNFYRGMMDRLGQEFSPD